MGLAHAVDEEGELVDKASQTPAQQASMDFWNRWCSLYSSGSIELSEITPEALAAYDASYLAYYPYLLRRIRPGEMAGRRVLEVGLGFGTLGQKIAEAGAEYVGIDVAENQVDLMNYRMEVRGLNGTARQVDFLRNDLPDASFDFVVSVGCFHHTGDIQRCVDETHRVLKAGGAARVMLYNRFSLRRWTQWPLQTARALVGSTSESVSREQRLRYDSFDGEAAPITEFTSIREARARFRRFSHVSIRKENCDPLKIRGLLLVPRKPLLRMVGPLLGLDLYIDAGK